MANRIAHNLISTVAEQTVIIPTVYTGGAYTATYIVGGKQTLTGVCLSPRGCAILNDIIVTDKANQKAELMFLFYKAPLAIAGLDNTAPVLATDIGNLTGVVEITAASYSTQGSDSIAVVKTGNINNMMFNNDGTQNLYLLVVTSGTPTYTALALQWTLNWSNVF